MEIIEIVENGYQWMKVDENVWKWMKVIVIDENRWKIMDLKWISRCYTSISDGLVFRKNSEILVFVLIIMMLCNTPKEYLPRIWA